MPHCHCCNEELEIIEHVGVGYTEICSTLQKRKG